MTSGEQTKPESPQLALPLTEAPHVAILSGL